MTEQNLSKAIQYRKNFYYKLKELYDLLFDTLKTMPTASGGKVINSVERKHSSFYEILQRIENIDVYDKTPSDITPETYYMNIMQDVWIPDNIRYPHATINQGWEGMEDFFRKKPYYNRVVWAKILSYKYYLKNFLLNNGITRNQMQRENEQGLTVEPTLKDLIKLLKELPLWIHVKIELELDENNRFIAYNGQETIIPFTLTTDDDTFYSDNVKIYIDNVLMDNSFTLYLSDESTYEDKECRIEFIGEERYRPTEKVFTLRLMPKEYNLETRIINSNNTSIFYETESGFENDSWSIYLKLTDNNNVPQSNHPIDMYIDPEFDYETDEITSLPTEIFYTDYNGEINETYYFNINDVREKTIIFKTNYNNWKDTSKTYSILLYYNPIGTTPDPVSRYINTNDNQMTVICYNIENGEVNTIKGNIQYEYKTVLDDEDGFVVIWHDENEVNIYDDMIVYLGEIIFSENIEDGQLTILNNGMEVYNYDIEGGGSIGQILLFLDTLGMNAPGNYEIKVLYNGDIIDEKEFNVQRFYYDSFRTYINYADETLMIFYPEGVSGFLDIKICEYSEDLGGYYTMVNQIVFTLIPNPESQYIEINFEDLPFAVKEESKYKMMIEAVDQYETQIFYHTIKYPLTEYETHLEVINEYYKEDAEVIINNQSYYPINGQINYQLTNEEEINITTKEYYDGEYKEINITKPVMLLTLSSFVLPENNEIHGDLEIYYKPNGALSQNSPIVDDVPRSTNNGLIILPDEYKTPGEHTIILKSNVNDIDPQEEIEYTYTIYSHDFRIIQQSIDENKVIYWIEIDYEEDYKVGSVYDCTTIINNGIEITKNNDFFRYIEDVYTASENLYLLYIEIEIRKTNELIGNNIFEFTLNGETKQDVFTFNS